MNATERGLYFGTLAGIVDYIDCQLGRPDIRPNPSQIADLAAEFVVIAVDTSPHRDFGEKSEQMRQCIVNAIVKGYFDEMEARKRYGR
jgi:hypothetical protein